LIKKKKLLNINFWGAEMKKNFVVIFLLFFAATFLVFSQGDQVKKYMKMVAQGKISDVKLALPDLLAEYPDDPGVLLLHASVVDDANKAIDIYEKIVKKHPESEYADDAYWRIIQYYAIKGDLDRANLELEAYRKKFPTSEFLTPAADVVRTATALSKGGSRNHPVVAEKKKEKEEIAPKKEKKMENLPKHYEKEKVKEKSIEKPRDDEKDYKGTWGLQVGVYSTKEAAANEVERFRSMRLRSEIIQKKVDGASMHAVVIGDYSTKESAEAAKNIVQQQCSCSPMVFKK